MATYYSPFLGDGYDEVATIPARPGSWSEVRISYRRLSADENSEVQAKCRLFPHISRARHYAESFAAKITDWNLLDRDGKKVAISAENLSRLDVDFFDLLTEYLLGTLPSDATRTQLEDDLKNSSSG